ncbi:hypothetical protein BDQ12DRAFT_677636 [Crucibulum laeve]|uniref:Uncharacterized protein n=1 Tax=Crucibulum laeve TaxID=68775 RepID=A0A5C3MBF3_9AGAR|nr:hypothetical protein BDQ12DRAFT_677636 [Crucibulum laeve]
MFAKLSVVALIAASLASAAVRAPAKSNAASVTSNLLACSDTDLHGTCLTFAYTTGTCYNLPSEFNDVISSITPQGDAHVCTLYQDYNCGGSSHTITQYQRWLSEFNDCTSSFSCSA